MKRLLLICLFGSVINYACGQNDYTGQSSSSLYFRQFFFNPYLYNPAYVGISGQTEVNLVYRQQWLNWKDAPVTAGLSIQHPTKGRVSLGLNILSDKSVALRNSIVMATFGYALPLGESQTLRFGLSGGIGMNNVDLTADELSNNIVPYTNNYYFDGNFGVVYTLHGLRLGFALTKLFDVSTTSPKEFNETKFSRFKNRLYSASYKINFGSSPISIEPYVLYRERDDNLNAWEAATTVYYKNTLWAGAAFHQTNGLGIYFGLNVKERFRFSYSYDFPPVSVKNVSTSSHELHIGVLLGKKKQTKATKKEETDYVDDYAARTEKTDEDERESVDSIAQTPPEERSTVTSVSPTPQQPAQQEKKEYITITSVTPSTETVASPEVTKTSPPPTKPPVAAAKKPTRPPLTFTLSKGIYVVVGVYSIIENASRYLMQLKAKGFNDVNVALNPKNDKYYVYTYSTYDVEEARKERNQYRLKRPFSEAWIYTFE